MSSDAYALTNSETEIPEDGAPRTEQTEQQPGGEMSENGQAALPTSLNVKRVAGYTAVTAAAVLGIIGGISNTSRMQEGKHAEPEHTAPAAHTPSHSVQASRAEQHLRLQNLTIQAEQAVLLVHFYKHEGNLQGLHKCLETLKTWKEVKTALHGEYRENTNINGLVISLTNEQSREADLWKRVTGAMKDIGELIGEAESSQ